MRLEIIRTVLLGFGCQYTTRVSFIQNYGQQWE